MKKVVIAGSTKLQNEINNWKTFFESQNYQVLDYPKKIDKEHFTKLYPNIYKDFFPI